MSVGAVLGIVPPRASVLLANGLALLVLAAAGWFAARGSGDTRMQSFVSAVVSTSIGLAIVAMELLVHHLVRPDPPVAHSMSRQPNANREDLLMSAIRRAEVTWTGGDLATGSGVVSAVSSNSFSDLPVSWAARTEAPGGKTSPEELIAAAHASCYAMAFSGRPRRNGTPPERLDVSADVTFDKLDAGWRVVSSALTVRGRVPGITNEAFVALAEAAKDGCPVSQALQGNVALSVDAASRARRGVEATGRPPASTRPSGSGAGWRLSSSRSRPRRRRRRGAAAGTSGEVDVAVALVRISSRIVADVLAEQQPLDVAAPQQLADQLDDPALAGPLLRREAHPEEVELDAGAALDDREVVVEDAYESAWPMTTRPGSTPSSSKIFSCSSPIDDMTAWVVTARPVRRAARPAARWTRSSAVIHGLSVPISPTIPGLIPVSPTPSVASRTSSSASESTDRRSMSASAG